MHRDAGDIIDRFSIATLKAIRIDTKENHKEADAFEQAYQELRKKHPNIYWEDLSLIPPEKEYGSCEEIFLLPYRDELNYKAAFPSPAKR